MATLAAGPRLRIVMPGGSGQIGNLLARHFHERGHQVTVLTRGPYAAPWQTVHWDGVHMGDWVEELNGADVCIHLSGRSINCRYTAKHRREIYDSRIGTTRLLHRAMAGLSEPPRVWLNGSAATIYRHSLDRPMDEATGELGGGEKIGPRRCAPETWDFMVRVVKDWEAAFFEPPLAATRRVALRTSIVFGAQPGSVFAVLSGLVRAGLGGTQGPGNQFLSWIHEEDYARAVEFLIAHEEMEGAVNLTAPEPLPNREFMAALREAWERPNGLPAPTPLLALGALVMRNETELVLKSRRVVPGRLLDAGFAFAFPEWQAAASDLVQRWRARND